MFSSIFQVRFDECAVDSTARASALLRYSVETAFGHSAAKGFPLAWYDAHRLYWLVRRASIHLIRPVPYGSTLTVTTQVVGFRRIWARRHNIVQDGAEVVGEVTMDWIFTDHDGNPVRVRPEMEQAFPGLSERFSVERLDVGQPPTAAARAEYRVPSHEVDPRRHMNSAAYVDLFEDALIAMDVDPQQRPATYEVEFLRPSLPGEVLQRTVWPSDGDWLMLLTSSAVEIGRARRAGSV